MVNFIPGLGIKAFTLEARLGKGASGEVWSASDGAFKVALKLLKPELVNASSRPVLRQRQLREIDALRSLEPNSHLPVLYDWDLDHIQPYLAMQLIEGDTYDRLIRAGKLLQLPLGKRLDIIRTLADSLALLHEAGLLHRDIKPANVSRVAAPVLMDYRISLDEKRIDWSELSASSQAYQPIDGVRDQLGDIYSFGLLAYEILLGQHAIYQPEDHRAFSTSPNAATAIAAQRLDSGQWRAPSRLAPVDLPPDMRGSHTEMLDFVFLKALGIREQRYDDPRDFAAALEAVLKTKPEAWGQDTQPDQAIRSEVARPASSLPKSPRRMPVPVPLVADEAAHLPPHVARSVVPMHLESDIYFPPEPAPQNRGTGPLLTIGLALGIIILLFVVSFFVFGGPPGAAAPTATASLAAVIADSASPTATSLLPSPSATNLSTASPTATATVTMTASATSTRTPDNSPTPSRTASHTPTRIPTNTPTNTPRAIPPTNTPIPPESYVPSDDLVENLLTLRLAINADPYGCALFNRMFEHIQTETQSENPDYRRYGPLIIDAMQSIREEFCLPAASNPSTLPETLDETNSALDLLLWEIVLDLRSNF